MSGAKRLLEKTTSSRRKRGRYEDEEAEKKSRKKEKFEAEDEIILEGDSYEDEERKAIEDEGREVVA